MTVIKFTTTLQPACVTIVLKCRAKLLKNMGTSNEGNFTDSKMGNFVHVGNTTSTLNC